MYWGARSGQLWFAVTLILLGSIFLLRNYAGIEIGNWWALFILIPASGSLATAWNGWRSGLHPSAVAGSLVAGLVMLSVAAIFLLDLQWSQVWPIFLILGGIGTLVPSLLGRRARPQEDAAVTRS